MHKKLSDTENVEINKTKVDIIKKILSKLQKIVDNVPKNNAFKIEDN